MKKTLFIVFAAASMLFSACQKGSVRNDSLTREVMIETGSSDLLKSHFNGTGQQEWSYGDKMSVFDGYGTRTFTSFMTGANVVFSGIIASEATSLIAVYPESFRNESLSATSVAVDFPSVQIATQGGFTDGSNPMVGKTTVSEHMSLDMKNAGSYLKFTIPDGTGIDISSILIVSGGEVLSGTIPVDISGSEPVASAGSGYYSVALLPGKDTEYIAPGTYYAVVPPVTLAHGLTFVAKRSDGKVGIKSGTTANTLLRNSSKNLGTIDLGSMEWTDVAEYADKAITLDFSSASIFTTALPTGKTIGEKTYTTPSGEEFTFSIDDSNANTRGPGWKLDSGRLNLLCNSYYSSGRPSDTIDGITLPAISGMRLKSVTFEVGGSNTFQAVIINPDGTLVPGGMDEDATNWQKNTTHTLSLKGTKPSVRYKISAKAANTFIYISRLTLKYEKIAIAAPTEDPTVSFDGITDNGDDFNW